MSVKDKAVAIDRFVRTIKASGVYDDIGTASIMAGWKDLAGALTPLKGSAPTNNGFQDADLDPGIGLKGDGSTKNLATGRAQNADPQDSKHMSVYAASPGSTDLRFYIGSGGTNWSGMQSRLSGTAVQYANNSTTISSPPTTYSAGLLASSRSSSSSFSVRSGGTESTFAATSGTPPPDNVYVFDRLNANLASNATLSWYSIGSATDLAALDSAVSTLMADLRAIDEAGFDRDALAYIRNVEAADGSYLETGVKQAINAFVVGCKKDGIWDALKASCILCGARTISGALVPLVGVAPTPYNFASGDYSRTTGLVGDGATKYLDTNFLANALASDSVSLFVNGTGFNTSYAGSFICPIGAYLGGDPLSSVVDIAEYETVGRRARVGSTTVAAVSSTGILADCSICGSATPNGVLSLYQNGQLLDSTSAARSPSLEPVNFAVFARGGSITGYSDARMNFYGIGDGLSSLAVAALDTRVSTLVTAIAAAI